MSAWQWTFNGITLGDDTSVDVSQVTGLDMPALRTGDSPMPGAHGQQPGIDRMEARTIDMSIEIIAPAEEAFYGTLKALQTAFAPRDDDIPLTFQLDESQPVLRVNCRPRRRSLPITIRHVQTFATGAVQFVASDPFVYSDAEHSSITTAPTAPEGFTFPVTFPFNFGSPGTGGSMQAVNSGDAPAPWRAVVMGPCLNPKLASGGRHVTWEGQLLAGETLVLDSHPQRLYALKGGTATFFSLITPDSVWWALNPGDNQIDFQTADNAGSVTFSWRDTYWAAT